MFLSYNIWKVWYIWKFGYNKYAKVLLNCIPRVLEMEISLEFEFNFDRELDSLSRDKEPYTLLQEQSESLYVALSPNKNRPSEIEKGFKDGNRERMVISLFQQK